MTNAFARTPAPTDAGASGFAPIEVDGLVKQFQTVTAVNGVSFHVHRGEIFGLLGPNGAGKTTTIQVLTTLLLPTAGTARVAGFNVVTEPADVRRRIGIVFQEPSLDEALTGYENLRFHARLYGMPAQEAAERIGTMLELVELHHRQGEPVKRYSGGMKRRLEVARALLHRPAVLFLDEPTTGLDPQTRARVWDYVHELRAREGTTVLMTTHYMDEAEHCDRIAIMDEGRIIACDTPANLKAQLGADVLTLRSPDPEGLQQELAARFGVTGKRIGERLVIRHPAPATLLPQLLTELAPRISGIELAPPTLEDVFLTLTGRRLRSGER